MRMSEIEHSSAYTEPNIQRVTVQKTTIPSSFVSISSPPTALYPHAAAGVPSQAAFHEPHRPGVPDIPRHAVLTTCAGWSIRAATLGLQNSLVAVVAGIPGLGGS